MKGALVHHPEGDECAVAASLRLFEYLQDTGGLLPGRKESSSVAAVLATFFMYKKYIYPNVFPCVAAEFYITQCCLTFCVITATEG